MNRETPCDWGSCPYDSGGSDSCRYYCGLGADDDSIDITDFEIENIELMGLDE